MTRTRAADSAQHDSTVPNASPTTSAPRKLVAIVAACLAFTATAGSARAQECVKLHNALNACDVMQGNSGCTSTGGGTPVNPTWGQMRAYNIHRYVEPGAGAVYKACEQYFRMVKSPPDWKGYMTKNGNLEVTVDADGLGGMCHIDINNSCADPGAYGETSANCFSTYERRVAATLIYSTNVTREPQCSRTPNGPYKDYPGGPSVVGGQFSSTQRETARQLNRDSNVWGWLVSDAWDDPVNATDEFSALVHNSTLFHSVDDPDGFLFYSDPNYDGYAHGDHIIPRIDISGCKCGDNSYANLAIISRELNIRMSNDMNHPDRIKMMQAYTLP